MAVVLAHDGHVVPTLPVSVVAIRWLVLLLAALVVAALLRRTTKSSVAVAGVVAVGSGIAATSASTWTFALVSVTHRAAAALWLGAVLALAVTRSWRRLAPLGMVAATAVAVSGFVQARLDRVGLDAFAFDQLVLAKALLFALACSLGLQGIRRAASGRLVLLESAVLFVATVAGSALTLLPSPPKVGVPLVSAAGPLQVTVVPQRPGLNLVHVYTDVPLLIDGQRTTTYPGASGQWARITLPAGRSEVRVGNRTLLVDAGHSTAGPVPDGPECASAFLGASLAHRALRSCPSSALSVQDRHALETLTGWLKARGVMHVQVLGDSTPRSKQAASALTGKGGTGTVGAVLLTGSWDTAARQLAALSGRAVPRDGVYLAPWLLSAPLLSSYSTTAPLLALPFDPHGSAARRYLVRLPAGETPTGSGYAAFTSAQAAVQIWATAPVSIFPKDLGHAHATAGWFPGGTLTAVTFLR
ncbi:MAG: hypothetical protein JWM02_3362 [Frankiales bacterium]|nr:hypothetical protein [Frankiales bacterium]